MRAIDDHLDGPIAEVSGARARIDRSWALEILSGKLSPLAALERRINGRAPSQFESVRVLIGDRDLERIDSRLPRAERLDDSARVEAM